MAADFAGDRIELRGVQWLLYCGVLPYEQRFRQPFALDLDLYVELAAAGASDDLDQTVDYGAVLDRLGASLTAKRFNLMEAVAHDVAAQVLAIEAVSEVTVSVHKLRPPVEAVAASTGVRIHRRAVDGA